MMVFVPIQIKSDKLILQNVKKRWQFVTPEHFRRLGGKHVSPPTGRSISQPRTLSAGNFNIRRRSCECSLNSKTLLRLQQLQQQSRLSKTCPSTCALISAKTTPSEEVSMLSPPFEKRIENLFTRLAGSRLKAGSSAQEFSNPESKWSIVRRELQQKRLKSPLLSDDAYGDRVRVLKSNLVTKPKRDARNFSVRWSDSVPEKN